MSLLIIERWPTFSGQTHVETHFYNEKPWSAYIFPNDFPSVLVQVPHVFAMLGSRRILGHQQSLRRWSTKPTSGSALREGRQESPTETDTQANVWSRYVYIYISTYNHIYHIHKEYGKACESRHLFQFGEIHIHIHIQQYSIIFWHVFGIIHIPDMEISPTNVVIMYQELSSKKSEILGSCWLLTIKFMGRWPIRTGKVGMQATGPTYLMRRCMYIYIYTPRLTRPYKRRSLDQGPNVVIKTLM